MRLFMGAQGHVSVRSQRDPNHYYIARYVSAGIVSTSDIIENDLDSNPVGGPRSDQFEEVHIHGQITDSSVYGLVSRAYNLRMNGIIQQQAISLGGNITYLDGQAPTAQPEPVVPTGNGGGRGADRTWEYWLRVLPIN